MVERPRGISSESGGVDDRGVWEDDCSSRRGCNFFVVTPEFAPL